MRDLYINRDLYKIIHENYINIIPYYGLDDNSSVDDDFNEPLKPEHIPKHTLHLIFNDIFSIN